MISLLLSYRNHKVELSEQLLEILHNGIIYKNNSLLLKSFYDANSKHVNKNQFDDLTAYEAFINGFMINDFCCCNYLKNGLLFTDYVCNIIKETYSYMPIEIILCKTTKYYHFMMHTIRLGEVPYLEKNIETYTEPTMVVRLLPNSNGVLFKNKKLL